MASPISNAGHLHPPETSSHKDLHLTAQAAQARCLAAGALSISPTSAASASASASPSAAAGPAAGSAPSPSSCNSRPARSRLQASVESICKTSLCSLSCPGVKMEELVKSSQRIFEATLVCMLPFQFAEISGMQGLPMTFGLPQVWLQHIQGGPGETNSTSCHFTVVFKC